MTSPRIIIGSLSLRNDAKLVKFWNRLFLETGDDAFFDFYRTTEESSSDLSLRLSEMFLHERRGYVIGEEFQSSIIALSDELSPAAKKEGRVDTVVNEGGVLIGHWFGDFEPAKRCIEQYRLWFAKPSDNELIVSVWTKLHAAPPPHTMPA